MGAQLSGDGLTDLSLLLKVPDEFPLTINDQSFMD